MGDVTTLIAQLHVLGEEQAGVSKLMGTSCPNGEERAVEPEGRLKMRGSLPSLEQYQLSKLSCGLPKKWPKRKQSWVWLL